MPTEERGVACVGVSKTYATATGVIKALSSIDAGFRPGRVTAVMGPSGSGKSSLLRVIAGLDRPDAGRVIVDGIDIGRLPAPRLRRVRHDLIGYVFQRPEENFIPYLTIDQNLDVIAKEAPHRREADVLDRLGLADRGSHLPGDLSGGEQQRAALAQALVVRPPFVVADEPTAELDAESGRLLLDAITDAAAGGVGFILATHDPEVAAIADDIVQIDSGVTAYRSADYSRGQPQKVHRPMSPTGPAGRQTVVRGTSLSKSYATASETIHALSDVSFRLYPGELVALMGRSGSGKTTLLNILAGWERADSGALSGDFDSVQRPTWRETSVVPQTLSLIDELTIGDNIGFPLRLSGTTDDAVGSVVDRLGLEKLLDRFPREASLGEQQRCAIARAVVVAPRLLLADEPTAHQDAVSARRIFDALRGAVAAGGCVVAATHDARLLEHADRALWMEDGHLKEA